MNESVCIAPDCAIWHLCQEASVEGAGGLCSQPVYCNDSPWCNYLYVGDTAKYLREFLPENCPRHVQDEVFGYLAIGIVQNILALEQDQSAYIISRMLNQAQRCYRLCPEAEQVYKELKERVNEERSGHFALKLWPRINVQYECLYPELALINACPNVKLPKSELAPYCGHPSKCSMTVGKERWCSQRPEDCSEQSWQKIKGYVWAGVACNLLDRHIKANPGQKFLSKILQNAAEFRSLTHEESAIYRRLCEKMRKLHPNHPMMELWPN